MVKFIFLLSPIVAIFILYYDYYWSHFHSLFVMKNNIELNFEQFITFYRLAPEKYILEKNKIIYQDNEEQYNITFINRYQACKYISFYNDKLIQEVEKEKNEKKLRFYSAVKMDADELLKKAHSEIAKGNEILKNIQI